MRDGVRNNPLVITASTTFEPHNTVRLNITKAKLWRDDGRSPTCMTDNRVARVSRYCLRSATTYPGDMPKARMLKYYLKSMVMSWAKSSAKNDALPREQTEGKAHAWTNNYLFQVGEVGSYDILRTTSFSIVKLYFISLFFISILSFLLLSLSTWSMTGTVPSIFFFSSLSFVKWTHIFGSSFILSPCIVLSLQQYQKVYYTILVLLFQPRFWQTLPVREFLFAKVYSFNWPERSKESITMNIM
jgi:hypothetical protein